MKACLAVSALGLFTVVAVSACNSNNQTPAPGAKAPDSAATTNAATPQSANANLAAAVLGGAAPQFELSDLDGKPVRLADTKGKLVVLEWFNAQCPFVKASHTKGSLVDTAKKWQDKGVVWLAINSSAEGKQGFGVDTNREGKSTFGFSHPVLLDTDGKVGKAYGAEKTPHLYVIDKEGKLVYRGAIDNSPDGEGESPSDGKLINYVSQALEELEAGKPVSVAETKSYGCGVKYAN